MARRRPRLPARAPPKSPSSRTIEGLNVRVRVEKRDDEDADEDDPLDWVHRRKASDSARARSGLRWFATMVI